MSDFSQQYALQQRGALTVATSELGELGVATNNGYGTTNSAWSAANRAIFQPVVARQTVTVTHMGMTVRTQSGSYDVGIYDTLGNRIVALGTTSVPAGPAAISINITDTTLTPGYYLLAVWCDNTTAVFDSMTTLGALPLAASGVRYADSITAAGATALPSTVTYAEVTATVIPRITATYRSP